MNDANITKRLKRINFGTYNDENTVSVGGYIGAPGRRVGGSVGYDKKKKKVFGSANVNGKYIAKFGQRGIYKNE